MTQAPSAALVELAHAHGVATEYRDWRGEHVTVAGSTIVAVLAALGVAAGTEAEVEASRAQLERRSGGRVLPPVVVLPAGTGTRLTVDGARGGSLTARVLLEDGSARRVDQLNGEAAFELPADLPLGWHTLEARVDGQVCTMPLVVTPSRLELPPALQGPGGQRWGLMTQLYAMRSARSWGTGDLGDLGDLGAWGARLGADFVLVNPLHAAEPMAPMEPSPYLPTSRRFVNPLYIRVEDVPEAGYLSAAERQILEWHGDDAQRLNDEDHLDRDAAWAAKEAALRLLFHQPRSARRERAFQGFCEREGEGLVDFATWCALAGVYGLPWQDWPRVLHDPRGEAIDAAREELADEVEFQCWLQWVVAEQLARAQHELVDAGMRVGVIHDLAVGVHPGGADTWGLGDTLAHGVSVGAPPDQYNQMGQDWSQPPWRPDRLAEAGYAPYRDMLRAVLRDAGGVRVDHIIGLFRLWWVPEGEGPGEGTYVHYDHDALVGILMLEAHRAGAVVIGEDLGTVEDWVRDYLRERGLFGTSILWFERDADGRPRPAESYRELCLATVTTHDLPPTAGYLTGEHVDLRASLGLLTLPVEQERAADEAAREQVLSVLRELGLLGERAGVREQVEALHRFLARTPSKLLGVSVSDLAGDRRTINQPGTDEEYPNWRMPLAGPQGRLLTLEELMASRWSRRLARSVANR